jgi:NADPH:quinone reductase-like Zn-dependent oxidoreductase
LTATSVDRGVWHLMTGLPYPVRLAGYGLRVPKTPVPGTDVAGVVAAVGHEVTRFQPGDEVFGTGQGTFTEYARAPESKLAPKPANLTFEQAAVVAVSGQTALQGLRDYGRIQPGQKVLITGASGGVGTFAVQLAKAFGGPWPRPGPWSLPEARLAAGGSPAAIVSFARSCYPGSWARS